MTFFLFTLLNLILFVRPMEIIPALAGLPIYNVLILLSITTSFGPMLAELKSDALREQPITVCILLVMVTIVVSNVVRLDFHRTLEQGVEFAKILLYYLLLLAALNTPGRLQKFLAWMVVFIVVLTGLALLQYHGVVNIPSLQALERQEYDPVTGQGSIEMQLRSTGIYNDPNDLCLILVVGMVLALSRVFDRRSGPIRLAWLAPCGLFVYAVTLTHSRGGFLALLSSLAILFLSRFGWKKAIPLAAIALPGLFLLSGGRQTRISTSEGTAQERIHLWNEGLTRLIQRPVTGIGAGMYGEEMGLIAHNSFVHAYVELGVAGGAGFVSVFYLAYWSLQRLDPRRVTFYDGRMEDLRPFLIAMVVGYAVGLMSLSRCYQNPTFMVVGLVAAYLRNVDIEPREAIPKSDARSFRRLVAVSALVLVGLFLFVRFATQRG